MNSIYDVCIPHKSYHLFKQYNKDSDEYQFYRVRGVNGYYLDTGEPCEIPDIDSIMELPPIWWLLKNHIRVNILGLGQVYFNGKDLGDGICSTRFNNLTVTMLLNMDYTFSIDDYHDRIGYGPNTGLL